jgi:hypothetical protein
MQELDKYVSNKFGPSNPSDGPVTTKDAAVSPIDEEAEGAKARYRCQLDISPLKDPPRFEV